MKVSIILLLGLCPLNSLQGMQDNTSPSQNSSNSSVVIENISQLGRDYGPYAGIFLAGAATLGVAQVVYTKCITGEDQEKVVLKRDNKILQGKVEKLEREKRQVEFNELIAKEKAKLREIRLQNKLINERQKRQFNKALDDSSSDFR